MQIFTVSLFLFFSQNAFSVPFEGHQILMTAPSPYAIEAGHQIAKRGGNVVDVAVSMGLALAVTTPYYATLGGGGFALVKFNQQPVQALDFRETAPAKTYRDFYLKLSALAAQDGGTAVGIPGMPMGFFELHKKHGRLPWKSLFAPAIRLAQEGFSISGEWVKNTSNTLSRFNASGKRFFFKKSEDSYKPGETLKQPQLTKALELFRDRGPSGFYLGPVADDIVTSANKTGGVLQASDLKNYKSRWLTPLTRDFRGHKIHLMPPPSSGGTVIATALGLVEQLKVDSYKPLSVDELHTLSEILKLAFRGRSLLGDPDFHKNPLDQLLSKGYLLDLSKSFKLKKTAQLKPLDTTELDIVSESTETTHYSVMDIQGNAITLTVTANGNYGSAVVSDKFGITLNNEMDDFTTRPGVANQFGLIQGEGNVVQAGKRPLSSMSPTLVEKDGQAILVLGAPGGPRIISAVFQGLYRTLVTGWDMDRAVQTPRVHHQFQPEKLFVDPDRLSPEILKALEERGHVLETSPIAKLSGIRRNAKGWLEAAHDSRGEGASGGY